MEEKNLFAVPRLSPLHKRILSKEHSAPCLEKKSMVASCSIVYYPRLWKRTVPGNRRHPSLHGHKKRALEDRRGQSGGEGNDEDFEDFEESHQEEEEEEEGFAVGELRERRSEGDSVGREAKRGGGGEQYYRGGGRRGGGNIYANVVQVSSLPKKNQNNVLF